MVSFLQTTIWLFGKIDYLGENMFDVFLSYKEKVINDSINRVNLILPLCHASPHKTLIIFKSPTVPCKSTQKPTFLKIASP